LLPVWLLVDPIVSEPPSFAIAPSTATSTVDDLAAARSAVWNRLTETIDLPQAIRLPLQLHPYLVMLQGADDPLLDRTLAIAQAEADSACKDGLTGSGRAAWRIGGWLQTLDGRSPASTLRIAMRLDAAVRTDARYLRLADRRTLDLLRLTIGPQRLNSGTEWANRWLYLDVCSRLADTALSEADQTGRASDRPLRLSRSEWQRFGLATLAHPTLQRWWGELSDVQRAGLPTADAMSRALQAVEQAKRVARLKPMHLRHDDDIVAWSVMSLLHPGFEEHEDCQHWLNAPPAADSPIEPFNIQCHELRAALLKSTATV